MENILEEIKFKSSKTNAYLLMLLSVVSLAVLNTGSVSGWAKLLVFCIATYSTFASITFITFLIGSGIMFVLKAITAYSVANRENLQNAAEALRVAALNQVHEKVNKK